MLSIYVHSDTNPGFLDLPEDAPLELESIAEAFHDTEDATEFTLPYDLFWTDNNRRLLNFKERIENFTRTDNYFIVTVYDNHFPEFVKVKMTLVSKGGSFKYRRGKFSVSISGTRGVFSTNIKNKKLAELTLGGPIFFPLGMDSRQFAYWHYTTGYTQYPQLRFGPVGWEGFYDHERTDFNGEFVAKDTVNNIVLDGAGGWTFGRPTVANPAVAATPLTIEYMDYRTIPFFTIKHLLLNIFLDMGYTITGEFFNLTDFDNLVLFNNYSIERYRDGFTILTSLDENNRILPANHVPDMLIADFLKSILPGLGQFLSFTDESNVVLVSHNTNIATATVVNMDDVLIDYFNSDYLDGTAVEDGYKITLASDSDDQYYSERVKDISTKILISRVNTLADLAAITGSLTTDDMVYVACENMYYTVADATSTPIKWDAFAEGLEEYKTGKGKRQVDMAFSTLAQYVIEDLTTGLLVNQHYLGTRQKGTYITLKGTLVKNAYGLRLFYCNTPGNAAIVPFTYNHNRDASNTLIEKYSLALNLPDSLTQVLQPFNDLLQNAEVVKVEFIANAEVMERLRKYKKLQFEGVVFFLKKVERSIPLGQRLKMDLIPL